MEDLLKLTKAQIISHYEAKLAEEKKKLSEERTTKEYYKASDSKAQAELNGLHSFLDALPNAMPKEKVGCSWETNSVSTRLLSWLASRIN